MSKIKTFVRLLKTPGKMIIPLADKGIFNCLPDQQYLRLAFRCQMGKKLNLRNPDTFNEKLQWLKLFDRNPLYITIVDKYAVKKYVASRIGREYIIPTIGIWNNPEEINLDDLPEQFVLKCTHDSGSIIICRDKKCFNFLAAKKKLKYYLNRSIYWFGREWPYKYVKPRIIAEPYLEDHNTEELRDYKFFCFNGKVKCYKVDFNRFIEHRANYYINNKQVNIGEEICPPDFQKSIKLSDKISDMTELAEKLAIGFPFIRADFYDVDGNVYFGELTLYPASGFGKFIFDDNDKLLGSWLSLPTKKQT